MQGNLINKVDCLVIGGGMSNTFLVAKGLNVGKSLAERIMKDSAAEILAKAESAGCTIVLPTDIVVANKFEAHAPHQVLPANQCPDHGMILEAGPASIAAISDLFPKCQTLI